MADPPAKGWYPDPEGSGRERWWDGWAWTEATRQPEHAPPPPPPPGWQPPPPGATYGGPPRAAASRGPAPDTHLAAAIVSTLFCCLPFGIVAIVKASQVDGLWNRGDADGARRASESARNWVVASVVVGAAWVLLCLVLLLPAS